MNNKDIRKTYNLNLNWKFKLGDEPKAWQKGFDDSAWRNIDIPHDWSVEHAFDINNSSGTGYLPGGIGFYRKEFFLPKELEGKRVYIIFDGVYNNSAVWCNSYFLGKRPYGYTEFIYDITEFASFGDTANSITVKVDHKEVADSRWFTGSGIYRKVTIVVKDKICIDNNGTFVWTKKADSQNAELSIENLVINTNEENAEIVIKNNLYDSENNLVASNSQKHTILSKDSIKGNQDLSLNNPKLWSIETPCLYTCVTEIEKDGVLVDKEETTVGIRTFRFDADKGFFLNEENMKLKGVCLHHDAGCLGAAVRRGVWERRLMILKDMGCNAIRMSHNPHMPELYDLCDQLGFLVIDEAFDEWEGVKNKWAKGHNVYPPAHYGYYEDFPDWHEKDLRTLVLRDRNHPSIIMWSIGNEVDYPNDPYCHPSFETMTGNNDANKPAAERIYDKNRPNAERLTVIAKELVAIVKSCDTTRPVTSALAFPELSNITGYSECLDVCGYNYKEHLYEQDHNKYADRIIMGSENSKNLDQWLVVRDNDYISGQFLWTGIDYLGETRTWPSHGSEAGLMDTAGFQKPNYYFRKSLWSEEPMIKLFATYACEEETLYSKKFKTNWNFTKGEDVRVTCFTNAEKAELFLNGRSLGVKVLVDCEKYYITWTLPFETGELKAVSTDKNGKKNETILTTVTASVAINLNCYDSQMNADGLDMTHIVAEIVDCEGNLVDSAEDSINVTIEGAGVVLGLDNGNLEDMSPYTSKYRRAHNGKLLIIVGSRNEKGIITLKAEANKLKACEVNIICN